MRKTKRKSKTIMKGSQQFDKKVEIVLSTRDRNLCQLNPVARIPKQDFWVCYNSYRSGDD
jgi:hypothetical protein